ncbi:MAG: hypothetical protein QW318_09110 [Candidatus Caldarchaeum sp.]
MVAATYSTNTATTITSSTTTTITQTGTVVYYVRMASTYTVIIYDGAPYRTTRTNPPVFLLSITCNAKANSYWYSVYGTWMWTDWSISCSGSISGGAPPYTVTITAICTISTTTSSTSFSGSCSHSGTVGYGDTLQVQVTSTVSASDGQQHTVTGYCTLYGAYTNPRTTTC